MVSSFFLLGSIFSWGSLSLRGSYLFCVFELLVQAVFCLILLVAPTCALVQNHIIIIFPPKASYTKIVIHVFGSHVRVWHRLFRFPIELSSPLSCRPKQTFLSAIWHPFGCSTYMSRRFQLQYCRSQQRAEVTVCLNANIISPACQSGSWGVWSHGCHVSCKGSLLLT